MFKIENFRQDQFYAEDQAAKEEGNSAVVQSGTPKLKFIPWQFNSISWMSFFITVEEWVPINYNMIFLLVELHQFFCM